MSFLVMPLALSLTGCAGLMGTFGGKSKTLDIVDDLTSRVEGVHVESEISKQRLRDAVRSLQILVSPEFKGDPIVAFEGLVADIDASEQQALVFRKHVEPMEDTAQRFFANWEDGLEDFSNGSLRKRSRERMYETRKLYKEITRAADPAQKTFDSLNAQLRDYASFISHDFNARSISMIEKDVMGLSKSAAKLDDRFDTCLDATRSYVDGTLLRGGTGSPEMGTRAER